MNWEIRTPQDWMRFTTKKREKTFCATTERGEYAIEPSNKGTFAISLDGAKLTGFQYATATEAMADAEKQDKELENRMA